MRLWHQSLLPYLSTKRLVRQHCECCALRGNGWGRKHRTVDYVFRHSPMLLVNYHMKVIQEMYRRGYTVDKVWLNALYRGKGHEPWTEEELSAYKKVDTSFMYYNDTDSVQKIVYPEHDEYYLRFCLEHLDRKGEHIDYHD